MLKAEGNRLFVAGNFKRALDLYGQAVTLQLDNPVLYTNRAVANLKLGNKRASLKDGCLAVALDPGSVKALLRRAQAKRALGLMQVRGWVGGGVVMRVSVWMGLSVCGCCCC